MTGEFAFMYWLLLISIACLSFIAGLALGYASGLHFMLKEMGGSDADPISDEIIH